MKNPWLKMLFVDYFFHYDAAYHSGVYGYKNDYESNIKTLVLLQETDMNFI